MTEYRTTTTQKKLGIVTCAGKGKTAFTWAIDERRLDLHTRHARQSMCPTCGSWEKGPYCIIDDKGKTYTKDEFMEIVDSCDYRVLIDGIVLEQDEI